MQVDAQKDIRFFCGTSGSGKSHAMKATIEKEDRVLIFDPEGEYSATGRFTQAEPFTSAAAFAKAAEQRRAGRFRLAFEGEGPAAFDFFCAVAWKLATDTQGGVTVVVDELAGVEKTNGKAQGLWHTILTRGRKHLIKVRAGAQSPTEVSKTIMRQRSHLWVGHMTRAADWQYIAAEIPVTVEQLQGLRPAPYFDCVMHKQGEAPVFFKPDKPQR